MVHCSSIAQSLTMVSRYFSTLQLNEHGERGKKLFVEVLSFKNGEIEER